MDPKHPHHQDGIEDGIPSLDDYGGDSGWPDDNGDDDNFDDDADNDDNED